MSIFLKLCSEVFAKIHIKNGYGIGVVIGGAVVGIATHMRSLVYVGATACICVTLQVVSGMHMRSLVYVGSTVW